MGGTATSVLVFIRAVPLTFNRTEYAGAEAQNDTKNGTLKVEPVSASRYML